MSPRSIGRTARGGIVWIAIVLIAALLSLLPGPAEGTGDIAPTREVIHGSGGVPSLSARAPGIADSLEFEVRLDRDEYLPGERILVGMGLSNKGSTRIDSLYLPVPAPPIVVFRLEREGTRVMGTGLQEAAWILYLDGIRIDAGERLCDVFDLLEYFGRPEPVSRGGVTARTGVLPPGEYTLRAWYRFRAHLLPGFPPDPGGIVSGPSLRFSIEDSTAVPESELPALRALAEVGSAAWRIDRERLWRGLEAGGIARSRYLEAVARFDLPHGDSLAVADLAASQLGPSGGDLRAAALLRVYLLQLLGRPDASDRWLDVMESRQDLAAFDCYWRLWRQRISIQRQHLVREGK
ncbi:MAG: hypothetical protein ACM3JJ_08410 [Hyphomicrobiales bacterium]